MKLKIFMLILKLQIYSLTGSGENILIQCFYQLEEQLIKILMINIGLASITSEN